MAKSVLVVDDSFIMRTLIKDILSSDPELQVVGEATNGLEAVEKVKLLQPDVILLDIVMPGMNGIECLKHIKLISNSRVIIVSSLSTGDSAETMEARKHGAFDVIPKPSGSLSLDLRSKKGSDIVKTSRRAGGLTE